MNLSQFKIGEEFICGSKKWRCTDIGTRTVAAICVSSHEETLLEGPPYYVVENVFDEYDIEGCYKSVKDYEEDNDDK